jgi:methylmalonyl-CoA/ethylmalonyl-CoA epimerase
VPEREGGGVQLKRIHHIDYVVRDLDRAMVQYCRLFGVPLERRERLENRGVELARFRLGQTWIVLVQPTQPDSPVQKFLEKHGEGFFHIAYEVENLGAMVSHLKAKGVKFMQDSPRPGLEGWQLADLELDETFGLMTQLVDSMSAGK